MKTTFVSTAAMQSAVRLAVQRAQAEVADNQLEVTTGRHADIGLALGSKTARTVSLNREVSRLDSMMDNNSLVAQRLSVSQDALGQMSDNAQRMLESLITVKGLEDPTQVGVAKLEIEGALSNFISLANMSSGGEFLFSGINTDVKPMADFFEPGSAAKQAFDDAFLATFGFAQDDPQTADITVTELEDFLDNDVAALFEGAEWADAWSDASETNMSSRITNTELIESSTNANAEGFRKFAMTGVVAMEMLDMDLGSDTRSVLGDRLIQFAGDSIAGIDSERANLGVAEQRVEKANKTLGDQKDVVSIYIGELEGVDPYDAATRMNTLLTQMEASYSLTARIQQMSLMNYL